AAIPTPTPRCALAGVAASEPASVATATKAANVFFMSLALLEWRLRRHRGFEARCRSNGPSQLAQLAQSKTNASGCWAGKAVFFCRKRRSPRKTGCFPGRRIRFNEGERD